MSETKPHPKALEAQAKAHAHQLKRQVMKALVQKATVEGIRFVEIAPWNHDTDKPAKEGRMTLAYLVHHRNVVMVATSICHPDDAFDKLHGRALAAANLFGQRAILMRVPVSKGRSMKDALRGIFTHNTY
jgi:hypothetical protein